MAVVKDLPCAFSEEKTQFIVETLDPVLEEMVVDVLKDMPDQPVDYMIQWLGKRAGVTAGQRRRSMAQQNYHLKQELASATGFMAEAATTVQPEDIDAGSAFTDAEEDDEDCGDELPESFKQSASQAGRARQSVSAEAYGAWNQKAEFTPPKYEKTEDQTARLSATLNKSFMFNTLEKNDMETILFAMKECVFQPGTKVINEGDDGDFLFVIETGQLDCVKNIDGTDTVVKTCWPGDVFGELALLYNVPRAASVLAKVKCVCWQLERGTFNHVVKDAAVRRRNRYDDLLKSAPLLSTIGQYERAQLGDALKQETYVKGQTVVKQGDEGDTFYIVEEGVLYAEKEIDGEAKAVMNYQPGDYFGEMALLRNQPRAASVIVRSDTAKVLSLGRHSFTTMLGPLQHLLGKNMDNYKSK
jgi:cAMP-dependent protein kinase regulator